MSEPCLVLTSTTNATGMERRFVGETAPVTFRVPTGPVRPAWEPRVVERLDALRALGPGWNADGDAERVSEAAYELACEIVNAVAILHPQTVAPEALPLADGGLSLTWSDRSEVEIHVTADGKAFFAMPSVGPDWQGDRRDLPRLANTIAATSRL